MYASKIPEDPIYDSYIDPAVYAYPTTDATFPSLEAGSFDVSSYALPQAYRRISATPAPGAPQPQHTCVDPAQHETNLVYFSDLEAFELELHKTFGKNHKDEISAENNMLEPSQILFIEGLKNHVYPFSADDVSGVWFDLDLSASTASPIEDTATFCQSPSTNSTSDFEFVPSDVTLTSGGHAIGSHSNSCRRKRSISSSTGSGLSQSQTISPRSFSSDQNCSGLYFCRLCNRSFTLSKDLKRHTSTIHDKVRWPCLEPGCRYGNRGFSRRDKLLQHRRIHIDIKENTTSSRPSSVLYEGALSNNIGSTATSTEIRKEYIDWRRLEQELPSAATSPSSHPNDGKKSFKCSYCPQGFRHQHDRVRHLRTLHSKKGNGVQYRCAALGCTKRDKIWTRLDNFQKHLAKQHGVENVENLVEQSRRDGTGNAFTVTTPDMFADQGKLAEAEQMYRRALQGTEKALSPNHTSTLDTVNNLGLHNAKQGKLAEAEQMYRRALRGKEEALGPNHTLTPDTVNNLGNLYADQGKLAEAEQMYRRALQGKEEALDPKHTSILDTVNNLGLLYAD